MDAASYKDLKTSRGLNYHYFASAPQEGKLYLLFLHGFPSSSYDWRHQVAYFKAKGYGLIAPDMLGYGGTAKPAEPEAYKHFLIAKDIIDILDAENIKQCIVIGHDWGSIITSRLSDRYPERFIGVAGLAGGYVGPRPEFNLEEILAQTKKLVGYELLGYWKFFAAQDSPELIEKNWQSFFSLLFPEDPSLWRDHVAPTGALQAWLEGNQTTSVASWLSEEDQKHQSELLLKGGLRGPTNWYRVMVSGINAEDEKSLTPRTPPVDVPFFVGTAAKDAISLSSMQKQLAPKVSADVTIREFDTGHWVMLERKDEVNVELGNWIEAVISKTKL